MSRLDRVLKALERRLIDQGDAPVRLSNGTVRVLMAGLGLAHWEWDQDQRFREIDGLLLDALRYTVLHRPRP